MKEEIQALIKYRIDRAHESLDEAKLLLDQGHTNTFVNRLYYSCFYIVSALLLTRGLSSSKHSGIRSLFHQNFVKSGEVNQELGHLYDKFYDNRHKGDYDDFIRFTVTEVSSWYEDARKFVLTIEDIVKNIDNKEEIDKEFE